MPGWRFVLKHPALVLEAKNDIALVISDLHIGIEEELRRNGVYVPPVTRNMLSEIAEISEKVGAKTIIVLGDVKHSVFGASIYELRELQSFFGSLLRMFSNVIVVPGNHDGGLSRLLPSSVKVASPYGIRYEIDGRSVGLAHGHTSIPDYLADVDLLIVGHHHFYIRGVSRSIEKYPVWVRSLREKPPKEIIVVPAFNRLLGGAEISDRTKTSPVLRLISSNPDKTEIYTLDGYLLGTLKTLEAGILVEHED